MSALDPPTPVRRLAPSSASRDWRLVLGAVVLGGLETAAAYAIASPHLAGLIPSHWNAAGQVNGYASPSTLLGVLLGTLGITGIVLTTLVYGLGRSEVLASRYGPTLVRPTAVLAAVLTAVGLPWTIAGVFLGAAGEWPFPGWTDLVVLLGPALLFVPYVALRMRARPEGLVLGPGPTAGSPPGRLRFRCTACGSEFGRPGYYLLAPRVGVSLGGMAKGGASYYLKCPVCGERGWQTSLGWTAPAAA